ncbi:hypothetical protein NMY22_g6489 [Coprinellus aureogranulatus]|nr:hypothetical protein NMY22_g6489 [Coprinellus aureogranulatus]
MRDPRKPARIQDTPWTLSFPDEVREGGSRWSLNGWTDRGGSPLHSWLFFIGFIIFPLWWIAGFFVPIPRTRRLDSGDAEKGVVLDDPQVEHAFVLKGRYTELALPIRHLYLTAFAVLPSLIASADSKTLFHFQTFTTFCSIIVSRTLVRESFPPSVLAFSVFLSFPCAIRIPQAGAFCLVVVVTPPFQLSFTVQPSSSSLYVASIGSVINSRSALLSNYEVFTLLKELEADHLARSKTMQRIKKEEEASGKLVPGNNTTVVETSENLRTIEVEALQYLGADYLPTSGQTEEGIMKMVKALEPYDLTKAEKLQIVNLAPTTPVELYVIVEELEDRLGDRMDELTERIQEIQGTADASASQVNGTVGEEEGVTSWNNPADDGFGDDEDAAYDEEMFDDTGEGAGVEGDLDVEED